MVKKQRKPAAEEDGETVTGAIVRDADADAVRRGREVVSATKSAVASYGQWLFANLFAGITHTLIVAVSAACAHESEWQPSRVAPAPVAYAPERAVEPPIVAPEPCGRPGDRARWRGAAEPAQLCAILSRVRGSVSTIQSHPQGIFPPATRNQLRTIVEKCRSDLQLQADELARYSRATFRVLLDERGGLSLATSDDDDVDVDRFVRCATLAMRARSNTPHAGALYEFVVPPIPPRWWPDPRSPQSSTGLIG